MTTNKTSHLQFVIFSLMMSFFHVDEVGRSVPTGHYVRITVTPQTTLMLSGEA